MQMNRQRLSIGAWSALVLVLGSLWVGGLATASASDASDYLAAKRAQQRMQSAALPDPFVALRPAPERSGWFGRLVRLLLPSWLVHLRWDLGGVLQDRDPA